MMKRILCLVMVLILLVSLAVMSAADGAEQLEPVAGVVEVERQGSPDSTSEPTPEPSAQPELPLPTETPEPVDAPEPPVESVDEPPVESADAPPAEPVEEPTTAPEAEPHASDVAAAGAPDVAPAAALAEPMDALAALAAPMVADVEETPSPEATPDPAATPVPVEDGDYAAEVESSSAMFKVLKCVLVARGGIYSATITLSGTGYDKLYLGKAADAPGGAHIHYVPDAEGQYTFSFPVAALDVPIDIAAYGVKGGTWYDRTLTFRSDSLAAVPEEGPTEPTPTPGPTPTPAPTKKPEADLSGSTGAVDNRTSLPDGVYKPDKFTYSGGTGKVSWSCARVTVKGGRATADISVSSAHYQYVKANGRKYYASHGGNSSSFTIPVKLNASNTVIGMTTRMSVDHEVKYSLYIYIAAAAKKADADSTSIDGVAPPLAGAGEPVADVMEHARLFGVYRYPSGMAMLEVQGAGWALVVPEGLDAPEDVDPDMPVIRVPVRAAFVACENAAIPQDVRITDAGSFDQPDYGALLMAGCDLAVMPPEILDDAHAKLRERLAMLGIPVLVDRSADEETEQGAREWGRLYALLFGTGEAA